MDNKKIDGSRFIPKVSPDMYKQVSPLRRETLEEEASRGLFRDGSINKKDQGTSLGNVVAGGIGKSAQMYDSSAMAGGAFKGSSSGNTMMQNPEVYSPLWLTSNMSLPRDRATINAWCRSFYALNPIVQNAINLHSTYPLGKMEIRCHNKEVENIINEMAEETDLMSICTQMAQEYWLLGETFVMGELDERTAKWSRFVIQNPDYMVVKRSVIPGEPNIYMKPDDNLKRICFSNTPADVAQRKSLDETIITYVKRGQNIPLDNYYTSHLARKISPYETHGTSLILSIFRSLQLFDQIYECHDEETEVLTNKGFKRYSEVINFTEEDGKISNVLPKEGFQIACFNSENEKLEYHVPSRASLYNYSGDMYHYHTEKVDIKVTPNHDMWVSKLHRFTDENGKKVRKHKGWEKIKAKDFKLNSWSKLRAVADWVGNEPEFVNVCGKEVPVELYLTYLGYLVSEGNQYFDGNRSLTRIFQSNLKHHNDFAECVFELSKCLGMPYYTFDQSGNNQLDQNYTTAWTFSNKKIFNHFKNETSNDVGSTACWDKRLPAWVKNLSPRLLEVFLLAACKGDGSFYPGENHLATRYYTTSPQLADDIQEIVFKAGYAPTFAVNARAGEHNRERDELMVSWSTTNIGRYPLIYKYTNDSRNKNKVSSFTLDKEYKGRVWCFEVPTGLFITRRAGKITIQGNCKFAQAEELINPWRIFKIGGGTADFRASPVDLEGWRQVVEQAAANKNFKIFTHDAVTIETVGAGSGIYDTSGDIDRLLKFMYAGLMVPQIIIEGGGDITYSNGTVSLEVLRDRYNQFRGMMANWLRHKVFAPICKLHDKYEYVDGKRKLIVPEVEFNRMNMFDLQDYIQNMKDLSGDQKRVSVHTLYYCLGLDWDTEQARIRKEDIAEEIRKKEKESLAQMSLNELRSLNEDMEIPEVEDKGKENSSGDAGGLPGMSEPEASPPGSSEGSPLPAPPA